MSSYCGPRLLLSLDSYVSTSLWFGSIVFLYAVLSLDPQSVANVLQDKKEATGDDLNKMKYTYTEQVCT